MKNDLRVAVTSRSFSRHPVLRQELLERFPRAKFNDAGIKLAGAELVGFLRECDAAITALETLNDSIFSQLPDLKVVSKYGVGLDMLDLEAMCRRGIKLGWTPGVNRRSVAELAIAFMLCLLRQVSTANQVVKSGEWHQLPGRLLSEQTVGIIGCGHIGKDVAVLLRAFGCKILVHDIFDYSEFYRRHKIASVSLEDLLRNADVVTLHVPLDDRTRGMLDSNLLSLMKETAILVNTARGGLVDEDFLKDMLIDGRLSGAAFDVFVTEPPTDFHLLRLPNFIGTPHIGGSSEEAILAMGRAAINGLESASLP